MYERRYRRIMDPLRPYPEFRVKDEILSDDDEDPFTCSPASTIDDDPFSCFPTPTFVEDLMQMDIEDLFEHQDTRDQRKELEIILTQLRRESIESNRRNSIDYKMVKQEADMAIHADTQIHIHAETKIRLYEFVLQLLKKGSTDCVRWLSPTEGEFEITNSSKIAQLWGQVKRNPNMTYEKFARALRHYYKLGILINYKHKEKLRYKFSKEILLKNKMN